MLKKISLLLFGLLLLGSPAQAFQYPPLILFGAVEIIPQGTAPSVQGMMWQEDYYDQVGFWSWSMVLAEPFSGCDDLLPTSPMLLSPSQRIVAYTIIPELWKPRMGEGWSGADFPTDIAICDLGTGEAMIIAAQPPNATVEDGADWYYASRSEPTWSPDGTQIAWAEYIVGANTLQLIGYDLTTATPFVLVNDLNPDQLRDISMTPRVFWSEAGIGVENFKGFETYSLTGDLLSTIVLPEYSTFQFWISHADKTYLAYFDAVGDWYLADPATGTIKPMPGLPELYAINIPDGLAVRYDVHIDPPPNDITPPYPQPRWSVIQDGQVIPLELEARPFNDWLAIAPDGASLVYLYEDRLWQWADGEATLAADAENLTFSYAFAPSLVWTPLAWRVGEAGQ